jgi:hypothetical protein
MMLANSTKSKRFLETKIIKKKVYKKKKNKKNLSKKRGKKRNKMENFRRKFTDYLKMTKGS